MWSLANSHRWVMKPHTSYERRREMRVRESRHTVMLFDKKYYDCETGKYITDKLPSLYSQTYHDLCVDESGVTSAEMSYKRRYSKEEAWFVPKDDDFDEECNRDEEKKDKVEPTKPTQPTKHTESSFDSDINYLKELQDIKDLLEVKKKEYAELCRQEEENNKELANLKLMENRWSRWAYVNMNGELENEIRRK